MEDAIWSRVVFGDWLDCWEWQGSLTKPGYGQINHIELDSLLVHRATYELLVGPIPDGLEIDHLCRNRACCNPLHLEAVTRQENQRRGMGMTGINARKTACPRGHPYDRRRANGARRCSICDNARSRRQREAIKAARDG